MSGGLTSQDSYQIKQFIKLTEPESNKVESLIGSMNFTRLKTDTLRSTYIFLYAFYCHFITKDYRRAKSLYKHAIRRSECPKGAYMLLCNVNILLLLP